jgi:tetratricopeptide (TPR) repeat protein
MNYSGSSSLSQETRQRILSTFDQTLHLAEQGNRQEALLGCDFILRMDPQFEPARQLHERLKAATGAVPVDDLRNGGGSPAAPATPLFTSEDLFGDLDGLADDLPADLGELEELPAEAAGAAENVGGLRAELERLLAERRLPELLALAGREQARVMADPQLAAVVQNAQDRLEAEPYVNKFLGKAREALAGGDRAEVGRLLDKARALDSSHPGIADLARLSGPAPAAVPARPQPTLPSALPANPPLDLFEGRPGSDAESERRIAQLLDEGQLAFDAADHQGAIDAWSRIFLIDIDHQEAARRIEQARKLKAERERQVEEIFHDGVNRLESGDVAAARTAFEQVLTLQPGYLAAREYLQQIESGDVPHAGARREAGSPLRDAPPPVLTPLPSYQDDERAGLLKEEILVPPDLGEGGRAPEKTARRSMTAVRASNPRKTFLYVGTGVLVLVLAVAFYLYQNKDRFWPNSDTDEAVAPAPAAEDPIARATGLHEQGKTPIAIRQLERIAEGDPRYGEAQKLIAEWQGGAAAAPAVPAGPALTPEVQGQRQALLAAAREALAARRHIVAQSRFEEAATLAPLEAADAARLAQAQSALSPVASQVNLFRQHEWEDLLPQLWRLHEEDPANSDVRQMLTDSYYNMAVRDLQRSDVPKALEKLAEAATLTPDDPVLRRHTRFAETYKDRDKDLLYRIYVKYLPVR